MISLDVFVGHSASLGVNLIKYLPRLLSAINFAVKVSESAPVAPRAAAPYRPLDSASSINQTALTYGRYLLIS